MSMAKIILTICFLLFIWAFFIEPNLIVVRHFQVKSLKDKKIVFASDFHIAKHDKTRLEKIVATINKQNPDLVLFGGDYVKGHNGENTMPIEEQVKIFKQIKAPIVSIVGNHDGWYNKEKIIRTLKNNGITVLVNENVRIGDITIAGVDDLQTGSPDSTKALRGCLGKTILMTHNPDVYSDLDKKVDLILAGHVHGGQVRMPFVGALIAPSKFGTKFAQKHVFKETQNTMIVSRGLGTSILSLRFCCFPEIIVIN